LLCIEGHPALKCAGEWERVSTEAQEGTEGKHCGLSTGVVKLVLAMLILIHKYSLFAPKHLLSNRSNGRSPYTTGQSSTNISSSIMGGFKTAFWKSQPSRGQGVAGIQLGSLWYKQLSTMWRHSRAGVREWRLHASWCKVVGAEYGSKEGWLNDWNTARLTARRLSTTQLNRAGGRARER